MAEEGKREQGSDLSGDSGEWADPTEGVIGGRLERGLQIDPADGADPTLAAIEWLEERWGTEPVPACPFCGNRRWGVMPAERLIEGNTDPMYRVRCERCAHTVFIDSRFENAR